MKPDEIAKLTAYMRRALGSDAIELRMRPKKADSAEVYARDEFVGVVHPRRRGRARRRELQFRHGDPGERPVSRAKGRAQEGVEARGEGGS